MRSNDDTNRQHVPVDGFEPVDWASLDADELRGVPVYDRRDRKVADVDDVVLAEDGHVATLVTDVGGFLRIGTRTVALGPEHADVQRRLEDGELRVYVAMTEDELRNHPEHDVAGFPPAVTRFPS